MEAAYQDIEGVTDAVSGFTGGKLRNPTYSGNHQGHFEAVKVTYDPGVVSYDELLLDVFWHNIGPFDDRGQFCDKGPSYRSAIFATDEQKSLAEASREEVARQFEPELMAFPGPVHRAAPISESLCQKSRDDVVTIHQ
ncbi:MAG: peptide-methionine (S)-S-oxide reductase [Candidatus Azotimanducaceae bacterium WSBS_2022_MAG_OTU7]